MNRRDFAGLMGATAQSMAVPFRAMADETCQSPHMPKITGQEEFVDIWTLGVDGIGDEQDKLVAVDLRPGSDTRGPVIASLPVGGRDVAHRGGFSADRRHS